ncbi:MAG: DUF1648 domain-containing protein [Candidatus Acidiferrum sp.]
MKDSRLPTSLYFVMLILGVLQWIRVYPQLPELMASHFTGNGIPNGWEPKPVFFALSAIAVATSAFIAFVPRVLIASRSNDRINLPNKSYWLAPERREETMKFLGAQMVWFGCGVLFVLLYAASEAIHANLQKVRRFDMLSMWYVAGGFLVAVVGWTIYIMWHFSNVPKSEFGAPSR